MHVLYFHQYFSTPEGAAGLRSYQMARRLIKRGHRVTMVCGSRSRSYTGLKAEPSRGIRTGCVDGIDVVEVCIPYSNYDGLIKRSITFFRLAIKNVLIARHTAYDLLFATSTPLTAGIPGIVMKLLKFGKPFVFEVRDLWPELPKAMGVIKNPVVLGAMGMLEKKTYKCADTIVALSPGIQAGIRKHSKPTVPVVMIPNGCDLYLDTRGKTLQPVLSEKFHSKIAESKLRAVFTGAHGLANGLDAVLDAAGFLKAKGREDIQIFFIGDGKQKPKLRRRAEAEQLDNVIFLDFMSKLELSGVMRHMHVGLMILANIPAFYYGTSPNKFFDYIGLGLPVLNNYPGWLADLIEQHHCGSVVPPQDPEAFANALIKLADRPDMRKQMGLGARRLAEEVFDRNRLADQFVDCLEKAMC